MNKLIIITGPTGTGKTEFAINLAKQLNGELINTDSRQIYKFANIGTNKGNISEIEGKYVLENIPIHLVNFKYPNEKYSAFEFQQDAFDITKKLIEIKKIPIFVGGTGLYISSIVDNSYYPESYNSRQNFDKWKQLENLSTIELQNLAKTKNFTAFEKLNHSDKNNKRRLIRIIEKSEETKNKKTVNPFSVFTKEIYYPQIGLHIKNIEEKIAKRAIQMLQSGWIEETKELLSKGYLPSDLSNCGIGYSIIVDYLQNKITYQELVKIITVKHRQYAIKQIRWYKKYLLDKFSVNLF